MFALAGCDSDVEQDDSLNATLWLGTSAEYRAIVRQTYLSALDELSGALANTGESAVVESAAGHGGLPPAIILDIDQTLLDNSAFKSKMIHAGAEFDWNTWIAWIKGARIPALPGALEYVRAAESRGIQIYYISNRREEFRAATAKNLTYHGFPLDSLASRLLIKNRLKGWGEDKSSRRAYVAETHRVLQILGDDLNDFIPAHVSLVERNALVNRYQANWGVKWFLFPNPLYGSWERALYGYDMKLSAEEKHTLKKRHLPE
jgi:acid phosphatase